jgi:hypothetical protein
MADALMLTTVTSGDVIAAIKSRVATIAALRKDLLKKDVDYGVIPGTKKDSLLKPGAEKLLLAFRISWTHKITTTELGGAHRDYTIVTTLMSNGGEVLGEGIGSCTTLEKTYRYMHGPVEFTGRPVPQEYWTLRKTDPAKAQQMLGDGMVARKNPETDKYEITCQGGDIENPDPADKYNTCLKMATKRSIVDATSKVLAVSDMFESDYDDGAGNNRVGIDDVNTNDLIATVGARIAEIIGDREKVDRHAVNLKRSLTELSALASKISAAVAAVGK